MAGAGKGSAAFRDTIKAWLDGKVATDEFFALSYENPDKSFDACIDYILTTVKSSGCNGFTDDEIFGMALHYYDEEDLGKIQHGISAQCVVNHRVELTFAQMNWIIGQEYERGAEEYRKVRKLNYRFEYYAVVTTFKGWQVTRHIVIKTKTSRRGFTFYYLAEVSQRWMMVDLGATGKDRLRLHIFERQKGMCWQWRNQPFSLDSDLTLKNWNTTPWWRGGRSLFGCADENIYPGRRFSRGFRDAGLAWYPGRLDEIDLYRELAEREGGEVRCSGQYRVELDKRKVLPAPRKCYLPEKAETLAKIGLKKFAREYIQSPYFAGRIDEYWRTMLVSLRHGFDFKRIHIQDYFDYLSQLARLGLDMHSPRYVAPDDFRAMHAQMSTRLNNMYRREREAMERERYMRQLEHTREEEELYAKKIKGYVGLVLSGKDIIIRPLMTVREFLDEGTAMHHCVFTGSYYKKAHCLVLSARDTDGRRLETVEVDTLNGKILQSRGPCNLDTPNHKAIINLVNRNMGRIVARGGAAAKAG